MYSLRNMLRQIKKTDLKKKGKSTKMYNVNIHRLLVICRRA